MVGRIRLVVPHSLLVVACLTALVVGPSSSWAGGEGKFSAAAPHLPTPHLPAPHLIVVELFTSQGCSSCPPADKVLGELATRPDVLPLSWSIDYWDYLGWRDTFGKPEHTDRQREYNRTLGLSGVYTPQVIIQGTMEAIGSRRDDVLALVARQQDDGQGDKAEKTRPLPMKVSIKGNRLTVALGKARIEETASVWLVGFAGQRTVVVERGENKGQMLSYHNVVLASGKLGAWTGKSAKFSADLATLRAAEADGVAILVQYDDTGRIIAAARRAIEPPALSHPMVDQSKVMDVRMLSTRK